jgi:hypothetical protein
MPARIETGPAGAAGWQVPRRNLGDYRAFAALLALIFAALCDTVALLTR